MPLQLMIRSLTLTNFMAHAATTFALAPGLNVLCGPNNTGKSAVVEALRCLSTNPAPRHVIRHGATEARVEALLDNGWRVAWVRRKAHAIYEITAPDGKIDVYAKLGKGHVPEEAARLLKLAPVRFDEDKDKEVDVHLGDQRHPIFLLDQPGSLLADFLAAATESAHLMAMQELLRDKVRRAKAAKNRLVGEIVRVKKGLAGLAKLPELSLGLETLCEESLTLKEKADGPPRLEALLSRLAQNAKDARTLGRLTGRLAGLSAPPKLAQTSNLAATLAAMDKTHGQAEAAGAMLNGLARLAPPPTLRDGARLLGVLGRVEAARVRKEGAKKRLAALEKLSSPPALTDIAPLAGLIADMETLKARLARGRAYLAQRGAALETIEAAIAARLAEVGECPLCGGALDAASFLKKAGGHGTA